MEGTILTDTTTTGAGLPRSRPRANRAACGTCHRRKIKCDAQNVGFPCSNCRKHQRTDCVWHEKRRREVGRAKHDPVPIRQAPTQWSDVVTPLETAENFEEASERHSTTSEHEPGSRDRGHGLRKLSAFPLVEEGTEGCTTHLVEFIDQEDLSYRPIDKAARITYVGTDVSNINFLVRQADKRTIVHHFPTNRIDRRFTAHEPDRLPVEAFELPEKAVVDELLHAYFQKINPGFPVVDQERFMSLYRARDPADPPSLLLLHAMLLAGAHVLPDKEEYKVIFFRRAKMLIDSRFERNRDTIVQAALLLTWYSDGPEDVAANAWHWVGFATRTAMGLGMHRDADASTLVEHNKKMWRRVWWLLVQCDLLISLQYGRPLAINLDDCDVKHPQRSDYEHCGAETAIDYAIAMTELCIILCSVYRKCFGPQSHGFDRHTALAEADDALARWSLLLPQHLRLRPTLTLELWPATLQLVYNTTLILLHRPRPQLMNPSSPSNLPSTNDAEICSAAAGVIQSIFESLSERQNLDSLWVFSVTMLFTAMIQLSVEVRFSNPLLAIAAVRRYDSTLYSLRQLARYWPNAESILHFFEHSERLQRQNVHLENQGGDSPELLASPRSFQRNGSRNSASLSPSLVRGQASPQDVFGGLLPTQEQVDIEPEPQDHVEQEVGRDWRQLFPFTESIEGAGVQEEFLETWYQGYWQESIDLSEAVRE